MFKYQMTDADKQHKYGDLIAYADYCDYITTLNGNAERQHEEMAIFKGHTLDKKLGSEEVWIVRHCIWHEDNRDSDEDNFFEDVITTKSFLHAFCKNEAGELNRAQYDVINASFKKITGKADLLSYVQSIRDLEIKLQGE